MRAEAAGSRTHRRGEVAASQTPGSRWSERLCGLRAKPSAPKPITTGADQASASLPSHQRDRV